MIPDESVGVRPGGENILLALIFPAFVAQIRICDQNDEQYWNEQTCATGHKSGHS